jgi:hypothetical protein
MIKDSVNDDLKFSSSQYLKSISSISLVVQRISQAILLLRNKRPTVAEKAIQEELALCAEMESLLLYTISKAFKQRQFYLSVQDCFEIRLINIKLHKQLRSFIKAGTYNLNYLEQYFEHDFWLDLSNRSFAEQLSLIASKLELKKH